MQIICLGTASCFPTPHRSVSCTALRLEDGNFWLFDCGEGSQIQLQKSCLKLGRLTKIFITHLHGDHLFGLPGLLCSFGNAKQDNSEFLLEIYGPKGLRKYVRTNLELSRSALPFDYVVHELVPITEQYPDDWKDWTVNHEASGSLHLQEKEGRDILADKDLIWDLYSDSDVTVQAGAIIHAIPSFGFVITECDKPGTLNVGKLKDLGVPPGPLYGKLKNGIPVTLDNGIVIKPDEVLGPPKRGRKVTILGDTSDPSRMTAVARNSDVILHEATMENSLREKAIDFGHSTPEMAAKFAVDIRALTLVLFHYSQRYMPIGSECDGEDVTVEVLLQEAKTAVGDSGCKVVAAEDLMVLDVTRNS